MKAINLTQKFDFDAYMKTRGWSSILRIVIWMVVTLTVLITMTLSQQQ